MKKKSDKPDWRKEVEGLIPETVLERMVALPDFDIKYVRRASASHMRRIAWSPINGEIYRELLKLQLDTLNPNPEDDNVFTLGGILEYAFIVKNIEKTLRERNGVSPENMNTLDTEVLAGLRESLRAVRSRLGLG